MMNPEAYLKTNILIVGQGVSGLILNYLLAKKGIPTLLLDRKLKAPNPILAETIPPSTLKLLDDLDLRTLFENCATKTYGYESKWNASKIHDESFFEYNPFKYGLKLNKRKVLSILKENTQTPNINCNQILNIEQKNNKVTTTVLVADTKTHIESDFIIDATGRKRAVLKQFNISDKTYDTNLAFICYVPKTGTRLKYGFFTESFEDGWGTVSHLNETTNIITLYTHKNSSLQKKLNSFSNWRNILSFTSILKHYLPSKGNFKVLGKQANSSAAKKIYSNNCIAIGDAAIAFNPISSHGISNAIFCASEAAKAISQFYTYNNTSAFSNYENKLNRIFKEYLDQKEKRYNLQEL